ncbi:PREDICTED: DNA mismatch repair protein Msh6-like isoform X2 [Priapulus caudatus]|uniref:DNA mismatch repair protein n=1 Tax=Priapulus caudatus TaxID=37621 RepID=A0ABM1EN61_PRICU|nr:PREDICTED: DNA mismatch repair protein Msh6-like isoform X2 [Priapulus caudatus]
MSKPNTLFKYFTKTVSPKEQKLNGSNNKEIKSRSPEENVKKSYVEKNNPGPGTPSTSTSTGNKISKRTEPLPASGKASVPQVGELVWAKLEGYPWWPALICNHPNKKRCFQPGKNTEVHVQFFDEPPSRAWVKQRFVREFKGTDSAEARRGGLCFSGDPKWKRGCLQAEKALSLGAEERLESLVVCKASSDDDGDDDSLMDMDEDGGSDDDSKENHVTSNQDDDATNMQGSHRKRRKGSARKEKSSKRRRIIAASDSESENEYKPVDDSVESSDQSCSSGVDESSESSEKETPTDDESPVKRRKPAGGRSVSAGKAKMITNNHLDDMKTPDRRILPSTPSSDRIKTTPTVSSGTKNRLSLFSAPESPSVTDGENQKGEGKFAHLSLDFLQDSKIRDGQKRFRNDLDYDPRTLYVPEHFLKTATPALRQWWGMKSNHFDTILFFKVGKFYELYHMDAVTAVNELGLVFMKGQYAHSGFPEIAYGRYADTLIRKGYRVARVEQTETPSMMDERCKQMARAPTKFDKVVKREICRVTSQGTRTYSVIDGDPSEADSSYLLAVAEKELDECAGGESLYGVCFVDTSIGKFHMGQFRDDRHCSRLRTLIAHYTPAQLLYEKGKLSQKTDAVLRQNLPLALRDALHSGSEFWEASKTLKYLAEGQYFVADAGGEQEGVPWPDTLKKMISDGDSIGMTASTDHELAVRALGACTWYLQRCCLEQELLSMRAFEEYHPLDLEPNAIVDRLQTSRVSFATGRQHMVLDGITLRNLDILENSVSGTIEGTLIERLDQCKTPFGKRLLRQWLCAPLCNPASINDRLDAIDDILNNVAMMDEAREMMAKLPDFDRFLAKIHTMGSAVRSENHPDSRAIFFDDGAYSKKKITDFLATLEGFALAMKILRKCRQSTVDSDEVSCIKSKLLTHCVNFTEDGGKVPDISMQLKFFKEAFNHERARTKGVIEPTEGVIPEYDSAVCDINDTTTALNDYIAKQRKLLGAKNVEYWGTGRNRFQLEVPESALKKVPDAYELKSQRKGFKRYWTREIEALLARMVAAEDQRHAALRDCMRSIFHTFDEHYKMWEAVVQCLAVFDVLLTLAYYSRCGDGPMCRPEFVLPSSDIQPFIKIRSGRHPCICKTYSGEDYIPNHCVIGTKDDLEGEEQDSMQDNSSMVLVTGPNMGGKSTLMRQVGVIIVLAQLGCYVPAEMCILTPVDRVFTRLGARDRIMAGESTLFVELSETASILQHATNHSLILLDELGRGTATYDGTAIACAVVQELSQRGRCRTLFSTHYHSLVEEFAHDPNVRLGHMACMVENENDEDVSKETITFLYKFVHGACPKSYGFNAAKLAGIPDTIIKNGHAKAKELEMSLERIKIFRCLEKPHDLSIEKLQELQQHIMA